MGKESGKYEKKLGVYAVATPKLTECQSDIDMDGSQWKSLIGGNMWMDNYECVFAVDTSYQSRMTLSGEQDLSGVCTAGKIYFSVVIATSLQCL